MQFYVAVTDNAWFRFQAERRPDEVNFWQPGGRTSFKAVPPGAPVLFKLHKPEHVIAGGAFFVRHSFLPLSWAWEAFQERNGVGSHAEFLRVIQRFRHDRDPNGMAAPLAQQMAAVSEQKERFGRVQLIRPRLGQGAFRTSVAEAYHRRCALTGEHTFPVLEAAHIRPYAADGPHEVSNGLLLRSDFHTLFDTGLITITPEYRVEVSVRIREEWNNGRRYYERHGQSLVQLPTESGDQPRTEYLRWHNENVFVG